MTKKHGIKSIKTLNWNRPPKFKDYTTTTGLRVRLKAVPLKLIDKATANILDPEKPTYEMEVFGGDNQSDTLTEEVVKNFEATNPELGKMYRDIYNKYIEDLSKVNATRQEAQTKVILMRGIDFEIPDEQAWVEEMEFLGVAIPEGKLKRKYFYLDNEIMANPRDMMAIFDGVMSISGVPSEALAEARESFRDLLEDEDGEEDSPEGSTE